MAKVASSAEAFLSFCRGSSSSRDAVGFFLSAGKALFLVRKLMFVGVLSAIVFLIPSLLYSGLSLWRGEGLSELIHDVDGAPWLLQAASILIIGACAWLSGWLGTGGAAWAGARLRRLRVAPGPTGMPVLGCALEMQGLAHRKLASHARVLGAEKLMAFSVGCTRVVVSSDPDVAAEMLRSSVFQERPLKQAAEMLLFDRAMGFAAPGPYWLRLRRLAASCLFCPRRISASAPVRQFEASRMLGAVASLSGAGRVGEVGSPVQLRSILQRAAVNHMTQIVFGRRYNFDANVEAERVENMIRLRYLELFDVSRRCGNLVPRVKEFVQGLIDQHRSSAFRHQVDLDMVDILLALDGDDKLSDRDMVAVLWEMLFRGTDTIAVTVEWAMAELVLHPEWQIQIQTEIDAVVGSRRMLDNSDVEKLPSLQAFVTETFRLHPAGPLLSWARLATRDVNLAGYDVPKGTTCMVNMWSILRNEKFYKDPETFNPGRFLSEKGGKLVDVRGGDLKLAPFGSGRRMCPGRELALAVVHLWIGRLLQTFSWSASSETAVDMSEQLKLSCEMAKPLNVVPSMRESLFTCS